MFASNVVGLASASAAGLGNCGGGVALAAMPEIFAVLKRAGFTNDAAWRCCNPPPPTTTTTTRVTAARSWPGEVLPDFTAMKISRRRAPGGYRRRLLPTRRLGCASEYIGSLCVWGGGPKDDNGANRGILPPWTWR